MVSWEKKGKNRNWFSRWRSYSPEKKAKMQKKTSTGAAKQAPCTVDELKTRLSISEEGKTECDVESLCHAMMILDDEATKATQIKMGNGGDCATDANCQKSYYSAYKCKETLIKQRGGAMCTANSPGKIADTPTACGKKIASLRGTAGHGELFNWITNFAGPLIWGSEGPAKQGEYMKGTPPAWTCSVSRRSRSKYALKRCPTEAEFKAADKSGANVAFTFKPSGNEKYDPFATATVGA